MDGYYSDLLLFVLVGIAEGFMLWFLWNFHKAGRKR
jgi:hypothetical protein